MENTAAMLEALINQASSKLDALACDLDLKCKEKSEMQFSISIINLIQILYDMANELEELKKESEMVIKGQEIVQQKLVRFLPELFKKLQDLEDRTGIKNHGSTDLLNKFDNLNV